MVSLFKAERWRVISSCNGTGASQTSADVKIRVQGRQVHTAAEGAGPVDALANALRKALADFYPEIDRIKLVDYVVHIKDSESGTSAIVQVVIRMVLEEDNHIAIFESANILEASWNALVEGLTTLISRRREQ